MLLRVLAFLSLASFAGAADEAPTYYFKRVVLAESDAGATSTPVDAASGKVVYATNLGIFAKPEFAVAVSPYLNQPITVDLINKLGAAIRSHARANDRLLVDVGIPTQDIADGTVRFRVQIGRFSDITVKGNRWFSSELLRDRMGINPGDEVRLSVLENAVNWTNTNPFREVKVVVNPVANQPGQAVLIVGVKEQRPWRLLAMADNYGNDVLGEWHYIASLSAGNLWGADHQATYSFVTTDDLDLYQGHIASYRVPLRWRHFLEFSATYVQADPRFGIANVFYQKARHQSGDVKYRVPIRGGTSPIDVFAGINFKRGNNNLEYGGNQVSASNTDTLQLTLGGSAVLRDKRGLWIFSGTFNYSPGGLTKRNERDVYQNARAGSDPNYAYLNVAVQRRQVLPYNMELSTRLIGQVASTNLLGGEQLTIGGATSIRGFRTNVSAGDEGFIVNNELYFPQITTPLKLGSKLPASLITRFLVFYDAGQVSYKTPYSFDPIVRPMASAGVGMRMSLSNRLSVNMDYGWQLTKSAYVNVDHASGHFKAVLAF